MSSSHDPSRESAGDLLDQVVAAYVRAVESGDPPDRAKLLAAHPELAEDLKEFFRHRDRMEKLLDPLRNAAQRALNVRCPHCHNAIELIDHERVTDLSCPSCGSSFSLVDTDSKTRFPGGVRRIGQFQLLEQVGTGQFGCVWKARDLTLERTVAIKIPRNRQLSEAETEMFLRDARLCAQLHHPNIVTVHEVGKQQETIYIVSDFIQGASLKEWNAVKRLSCDEVARLGIQMATVLHHAHEAGIVHRDLKPGNVMMDLAGAPHLVDFGLAKRDGGEITMTLEGQILGTPAYMSPEQASGEGHTVDRRADVYSLGVILFELLTGELPFRGDKQMLIVQIINDESPGPRKLNAQVPRDLETICLKCLRKEPSQRYATAADLASDLNAWLKCEPIVARPVSRATKAWLWCRRRPAISSLVGLLVVVVVMAVAASREIKSRERARTTVESLLHASSDDTLELLDAMAPLNRLAIPMLEEKLEGNPTERQRLRIALARLQHDGSEVSYLCNAILTADPQSLLLIRNALTKYAEPETLAARATSLWSTVEDANQLATIRLRVAGALAHFCPDDPRWETLAHDVVAQLVAQPIEEVSDWLTIFQSVSDELDPVLLEFFRSDQLEARNVATIALARYLENNPIRLLHAIEHAHPSHLNELVQKLRNHEDSISLLRSQLASNRFGETDDVDRVSSDDDIPTAIEDQINASEGMINREFAVCPSLDFNHVASLTEDLRQFGYRPLRLRPYQNRNKLAAAILWKRDGADWRVELGLLEKELQQVTAQRKREGFLVVDVAGYFDDGVWRCAVIWKADREANDVEIALPVLRHPSQWQADFDRLLSRDFVPQSIHIGVGDGALRRSQIWCKPSPRSYRRQRSKIAKPGGTTTERTGRLLTDVTVYRDNNVLRYGGLWHQDFGYFFRVEQTALRLFRANCKKMTAKGFTPYSLDVAPYAFDRPHVACLWHRPIDPQRGLKDRRGRLVNLVIAMMMLGETQSVDDRLKHDLDPGLRTLLMKQIPAAQVDPSLLIRLLDSRLLSPDIRQALILCLGGYGQMLSPSQKRLLVPNIARIHREDDDGGVHAAAAWLLRKWDVPFEVTPSNAQVPTEPGRWFQDQAGNTLIVAKLPVNLPINWARSLRRRAEAGRVYAVASTETTVAQFRAMFPDRHFAPESDPSAPAKNLSWFDAVEYCHRLNQLHGIDESQWCYLPNANGEFADGMRIPSDFASRTGYRLQTSVEFRHSGCAGAVSSFFFGDDPDHLSEFAWYAGNAGDVRPVGTRMPNVLGLFDVHGNVMEWCYGGPHDESMNDLKFVKQNTRRAVIGGSFEDSSSRLGIYLAQHAVPGNRRRNAHGFRVARTLVPAPVTYRHATEEMSDWELAHWLGRQGKWRDAAVRMQQAAPQVMDDLARWQRLPRTLLFLGEVDHAKTVCDEMLQRFGDTQDPRVAHLLAGICLSLPNCQPNEQLERLATLAVQVTNPTHQRDMGMLLYRQRNYDEAEAWLQKSTDVYARGRPASYYLLAMTLHRRGDSAAALQAFERATPYRDEVRAEFSQGDFGDYWHHWLQTEAIRREAASVLGLEDAIDDATAPVGE